MRAIRLLTVGALCGLALPAHGDTGPAGTERLRASGELLLARRPLEARGGNNALVFVATASGPIGEHRRWRVVLPAALMWDDVSADRRGGGLGALSVELSRAPGHALHWQLTAGLPTGAFDARRVGTELFGASAPTLFLSHTTSVTAGGGLRWPVDGGISLHVDSAVHLLYERDTWFGFECSDEAYKDTVAVASSGGVTARARLARLRVELAVDGYIQALPPDLCDRAVGFTHPGLMWGPRLAIGYQLDSLTLSASLRRTALEAAAPVGVGLHAEGALPW